MAKNVLILSSSPRRNGNSEILCDKFAQGAAARGHNVEKICLAEKKINYCAACLNCQKTGRCVQNDDMAEILNKMVEADVIVMATPVYFYCMSGQIKTLIDRTIPRYAEIAHKDFYFIITSADGSSGSTTETLIGFRGFLRCLNDANEAGVIYAGGVGDAGEVKQHAALNQAYEMGAGI